MVFLSFVGIPLCQRRPALWRGEHAAIFIISVCGNCRSFACLCLNFRQFGALESSRGINLEKSNQAVFISADSHFSFMSLDESQIVS